MQQATIYLIPIPIAEEALHTLSPQITEVAPKVKHFFVEDLRTARRFLKSVDKSIVIDDLQFSEIDKHRGPDFNTLRHWIKQGYLIGIMSEAGCPGVADPGAELVAVAHKAGAKVVPLTGPNSLILALMASGLNGQSFCFNGYLPVKEPARSQSIKQLEANSKKDNQTQLFIETPYRNNNMVNDLLQFCNPETRLCIAQNITGATEYIRTLSIAEWRIQKPNLVKAPAVFLLLA